MTDIRVKLEEKLKNAESRSCLLKNMIKDKDNELDKHKNDIETIDKLRHDIVNYEKKIQDLLRQKQSYKAENE